MTLQVEEGFSPHIAEFGWFEFTQGLVAGDEAWGLVDPRCARVSARIVTVKGFSVLGNAEQLLTVEFSGLTTEAMRRAGCRKLVELPVARWTSCRTWSLIQPSCHGAAQVIPV
jgi:hypothetical protein